MTLTFNSREMGREIAIEAIHEMELDEVRRFHVELTMAIQGMDDTIGEARRLERDAGLPFDRDWMHKARKKRRITIAFASEAKRRLLKLEGVDVTEERQRRSLYEAQRNRFMGLRHDRLRALLKEELGPGVLEELESEAHEAAETDFKGWLDEHGYEQLYTT
jgi:predicted metal-dependent hydrolase